MTNAIQNYAPIASGVYAITNAQEWIFIGETDDIRCALMTHLQDGASSVMKRKPTGFVFEVCEQGMRASRVDRLVFEYEPRCNRRPRV